jgi:hypothetical protein
MQVLAPASLSRTSTPYNQPLNQTGRLSSFERPSGPVAEEPRESLVQSGDKRYLLEEPSTGDACRLWAYPLGGGGKA